MQTVNDVILKLNSPVVPQLKAPPCLSSQEEEMRGIFLAVESMRRHTTDEGHQIQEALGSQGFTLCGHGYPEIGDVDVPRILARTKPNIVVIQDKREWDVPPGNFRDHNSKFLNIQELKKREDLFKLTILKDAHHNPFYHSNSAEEMGCHAWIIYYHPKIISTLAPYIRPEHLIRTYHSLDPAVIPSLWQKGLPKKGCLLSGAISNAYPLRKRLAEQRYLLPQTDFLPHPGYHVNGCNTPGYLQLLSQYKVAICTASIYGYALRKIIEATACGCVVITDLPSDEVLPEIEGNLIRINPTDRTEGIGEVITQAILDYNLDKQTSYSKAAVKFYSYQNQGKLLLDNIKSLQRNYKSC